MQNTRPSKFLRQNGTGSHSPVKQKYVQLQDNQNQKRNMRYFEDIMVHKTDKKFTRTNKSPNNNFQSRINNTVYQSSNNIVDQNQTMNSTLPNINLNQSKGSTFMQNQDQNSYNNQDNSARGSKNNQDIIGQVTKLSNVIYILGNLAGDLLYFVENQQKMQKNTGEYIHKMKAPEFLELQESRQKRVMGLFQKFIIDNVLSNQKEKKGYKEIGDIMKKEIKQILQNHIQYVSNQESNLERMNIFRNKEVMLVTDFYQGVRMILDTYNYMYKEMGSYGKTRPEFENYVKSIHQFKSLLAADEKNKKAYTLVNDLEGLLRSQFERIDNQEMQIDSLKNENEKLTQLYENYQQEKKDWSLKRFLKQEMEQSDQTKENQTQAKYGLKKKDVDQDINTAHIRSLEEFYINTINDLKQENKRLGQQLFLANKKIASFSNLQQNKESEKEKEKNQEIKDKQKKQLQSLNKVNKEIQCCFIQEKNPITKRDNAFMNIIVNPNSYLKFANLQSREWCQCVINILYQDKILSEVPDEFDRRPKTKLQIFTAQWFLKKFGNKDIAEILLKDFLLTLKKYGKQSDRYNMFADFCELDELLDPDFESSNINTIGINKIKFRKIYMSTQEPIKVYLKLAHYAKITSSYGGQSSYMPLLPNILVRGMDLISYETVAKMLELLQAEDPNFENIEGFQNTEQLYRKFLAQDMGNRQREGLKVYNDIVEEDEDQYIRFDFLAKNLIELVLEKRFLELEALYISLQQKGTPKYPCSINFEDFKKLIEMKFPDKTLRWTEIAYKTFMDAVITEKTPIGIPILKLVPLIINDDSLSENLLKVNPYVLYQKDGQIIPNQNYLHNQSQASQISVDKKKVGKSGLSITSKIQGQDPNSQVQNEQQKEIENQKIFQVFDHIMELALLEETYKLILPMIVHEKKNESLNRAHESFKEEMNKLPKDVITMSKYIAFQEQEKTKQQVKESIDNCWIIFRRILGQMSQNK